MVAPSGECNLNLIVLIMHHSTRDQHVGTKVAVRTRSMYSCMGGSKGCAPCALGRPPVRAFVFIRSATSKGGCAPVRIHLSGSPTRDGGGADSHYSSVRPRPLSRDLSRHAPPPQACELFVTHTSLITRHTSLVTLLFRCGLPRGMHF